MLLKRNFLGNKFYFFGLLLLFFVFFVWFNSSQSTAHEEIYIFQVGQGDAILIKSRGGEIILVDGGPDLSILKKLGLILPFWQRKIDYLILSHPHDDHLFGLIEVWRRYQVEHILRSPLFSEAEADRLFSRLSSRRTYLISQRQTINLRQGCVINFLYPLSMADISSSDVNDSSLVFKFECPGLKILFTGDISQKVEKKLLEAGIDLSVELIKVSHHGSKTASSPEFLEATKALSAVISVGQDNKFQHPATSTLLNLDLLKFKVFRTDLDGDIKIYANNGQYFIKKLKLD